MGTENKNQAEKAENNQNESQQIEIGHVHGPHCNHGHHHLLQPVVRTAPKIGRNDSCSCGSGKKFKKCCGQ